MITYQSKLTALVCGELPQVLHLCGVISRDTSWLCMLRLRDSPLNPDNKHYLLCLCGLLKTECHILLECDLITASCQVMLIAIPNILSEDHLFTPCQLNALS